MKTDYLTPEQVDRERRILETQLDIRWNGIKGSDKYFTLYSEQGFEAGRQAIAYKISQNR